MAITDRSRLSWRKLNRGFNRALGRIRALPGLLPSLPGRADRLVIAPQDLRTADPTRASEIYAGRFVFAGKTVVCDGHSPFEVVAPSQEWAEALHSFGWLRHLRAADSAIARANARALVEDWMSASGPARAQAWQPEIVARRVNSFLSQAPLILHDADLGFYRRFVRNVTRQVSYLRSTAGDARDGVPRMQARVALALASLCIAGQIRLVRTATRHLTSEIERQVLADGGHISRNPGALIELLLDFLPLGQAYTARNMQPPPALLNAIDRMMPMIRFFRHGDGSFGLFNGMGPTSPDLIATVLAYDDARGMPVANAIHSGYQRMEAGNSILLMDTGCPPPFDVSAEAHAGCLSFELSAKGQRIIVNSGVPATSRENWRHVARETAAHSTVTFNDSSSCRFLDSAGQHPFGSAISAGPRRVPVTREEHSDAILLRASHDGYASRYSVIHQRTLQLAADGMRLDGEDMFLPASGERLPKRVLDEFAIRFHLHPLVKANALADGHGVILTMPNKDVWNFIVPEEQVTLEDDVFLGGAEGPRRSSQIVILGQARKVARVAWTLLLQAAAPTPTRRPRAQDPELPL
jgi:uncharacterized heparinase superfamily protein